MPYVNVPNDLSKVKTKMALNLTKRQLICFGCAAAVGIPSYLLARGSIGNTGAMFLMLAVMLPAFLLAMYEKDGLPAEKVLKNIMEKRGEKREAAQEKLAKQKPPKQKGPIRKAAGAAGWGVHGFVHGKLYEVEPLCVGRLQPVYIL